MCSGEYPNSLLKSCKVNCLSKFLQIQMRMMLTESSVIIQYHWCAGKDSNLHALWALPPQGSVSTNSTTGANQKRNNTPVPTGPTAHQRSTSPVHRSQGQLPSSRRTRQSRLRVQVCPAIRQIARTRLCLARSPLNQ